MPHYKYLVIGGGMTADAAIRGIRDVDADGTVGLVSEEHDPPYNRPPLTKALWKGKQLDSIWRHTERRNADMHLGRKIQAIDPQNKSATDTEGIVFTFDKLLLATGGTPRTLPCGNGRVNYYRRGEEY